MMNSCLNLLIRTCCSLPNNRPSIFAVSYVPETSLLIFYWYAKTKVMTNGKRPFPESPRRIPNRKLLLLCVTKKSNSDGRSERRPDPRFFSSFYLLIFVCAVQTELCLSWSQWRTVSKAWRWSCFGVFCCLSHHNLTDFTKTYPFKMQQKHLN